MYQASLKASCRNSDPFEVKVLCGTKTFDMADSIRFVLLALEGQPSCPVLCHYHIIAFLY